MTTTRSLGERVWTRVDQSAGPEACWPWTGYRNHARGGYGYLGHARAHRLVYSLAVGPIPDGIAVLHRCDNPPCCNPAHLWLGTDQDNSDDKFRKGRGNTGERNGHTRLTREDVIEIRRLYTGRNGPTLASIAARFGVHESAISRIVNGVRRPGDV